MLSLNASAGLNSSVPLFNEWDLERCPSQVQKAHQLGNRAVNFIPTIHFVVDSNLAMEKYCFASKTFCKPFDAEVLELLKSYYVKCFATARDLNLKILILPHIDPAGVHVWRNDLSFDPLQKYGGYSYYETVIQPLEEALLAVVPQNYPVEIALQGEMGKTIFHFARSYEQIFENLKANLSILQAKVGISLNFNKVGGTVNDSSAEQLQAVQTLINRVDFVGISAYHSVALPVVAAQFSANIESVEKELALHQITLPQNKELHFSEVGIGGGGPPHDGRTVARTVDECARSPWSGVRGAYSEELDPWKRSDLSQFRYDYYSALIEYLSIQNNRVTEANIWNVNTWDVQGLYSGYYLDYAIINLIADHNR